MPISIKKILIDKYYADKAETSKSGKPFHKTMSFLSPFGLESKPLKKKHVFCISFGSLRLSFITGSIADFKKSEEGETVLFNHFNSSIKLDKNDFLKISSKNVTVDPKDISINKIKILQALKTLTGVYTNGSLNAGGSPVACTDPKQNGRASCRGKG